jgi:hypothetical protein
MLNQDVASPSNEFLLFMIEQECTTYSCCDYINDDSDDGNDHCSDGGTCSSSATLPHSELAPKETVSPADRMQLVDWCYDMVDRCRFQRETVAIAMSLVDRFASAPRTSSSGPRGTRPSDDRAGYQLVVIAALYIAIKLGEPTAFGSRDFAVATRGMYSPDEIEGMELKILQALSWRMCPPTSVQAAHHILLLMLSQDTRTDIELGTLDLLREEVAFQTESAVQDYYFVTQRPSTVAAAAIMNAIESVCGRECAPLTEALVCVIGEFPFASYAVLLGARNRLLQLVTEEEEKETGAALLSQRTVVPVLEEASQHAGAEEEALDPSDHHIYHLVQGSLDQTPSSPRSVVYDDAWDESSCATIYEP